MLVSSAALVSEKMCKNGCTNKSQINGFYSNQLWCCAEAKLQKLCHCSSTFAGDCVLHEMAANFAPGTNSTGCYSTL